MSAPVWSKFGKPLPKADLRRDINPALLAVENEIGTFHGPIVTASYYSGLPGTTPTPAVVGPFIYLDFSLNNDAAFRQFKIPSNYAGNGTFHLHWTKTSNANEQGKAVRWRVTYVVFASSPTTSGDAAITPTVAEVEDTYDDAGTTTRLVHRTSSVALVGLAAQYYMSMKIEAITPVGVALASHPGLFSLDIMYDQYLNKSV